MKWFKDQLIPNLTQPSVIILDNASYHKSKFGCSKSVGAMRKCEVLHKLQEYKVTVNVKITSSEAKTVQREFINRLKLANDAGHEVLFTPPHYSDLQPIELLWAHIKRGVGRQYSSATTLSDVKVRLDAEFELLYTTEGNSLIERIISSVERTISKFEEEIRQEELLIEQANNGDTTESESSSGQESDQDI